MSIIKQLKFRRNPFWFSELPTKWSLLAFPKQSHAEDCGRDALYMYINVEADVLRLYMWNHKLMTRSGCRSLCELFSESLISGLGSPNNNVGATLLPFGIQYFKEHSLTDRSTTPSDFAILGRLLLDRVMILQYKIENSVLPGSQLWKLKIVVGLYILLGSEWWKQNVNLHLLKILNKVPV